ncbi:hypothetical protein F4X86_04180 [Candidatus Saccharibacteria bacterium]|nr:hypothetical protein [Candidatus Saccharibacteria bacterium]
MSRHEGGTEVIQKKPAGDWRRRRGHRRTGSGHRLQELVTPAGGLPPVGQTTGQRSQDPPATAYHPPGQ